MSFSKIAKMKKLLKECNLSIARIYLLDEAKRKLYRKPSTCTSLQAQLSMQHNTLVFIFILIKFLIFISKSRFDLIKTIISDDLIN